MIDFSFTSLENSLTMNDIIVTVGAFLAGWIKMAQKNKDEQIKDLNDTIKYLREELKTTRAEKQPG